MGYIEQQKERIVQELIESNKIKPGQSIDYTYFLELYEPYKDKLNEVSFTEILGITYYNYMNIKHRGKKAKVLKNKVEELNEEEKERILKELLESKKIKIGQLIDYTYFLELYEPYKNKMKETAFAEVLGISYSNYMSVKNQGTKAKVLKNRLKEFTEEKKEEIVKELIESNRIKPGQSIDYTCFFKLYEPYKDKLKELSFAEILEINYYNYMNIKNQGRKTKVLKNKVEELNEEEKERILKELLESKKIKIGQLIDYTYFLELYEPYKNKMKETAFAEILGITYDNYRSTKNKGTRVKIRNYINKQKVDRIKYIFQQEKRNYSKEEIQKISEQYEISINEIIQYVCCGGYDNNTSDYLTLLEEKGQIWIGEMRCTKEFANKHARTIIKEAEGISKRLCFKYRCMRIRQDLASEAIEHVLQKCGDVEENFYNKEDISRRWITYRIAGIIKIGCLRNLRIKQYSFYGKFTYKGDKEEKNVFDRGIEDKTQRMTQEIVEEKILRETINDEVLEETCIKLLMEYVELGLNREEALSRTGEMIGINPEEMLQILQNYMIKEEKVRITEDGEYVLGE